MFDNLTRYFSRRGTDKNDIKTSAATLADMTDFEEMEPKEYTEQDIDAVSLDAPALDDLIVFEETALAGDVISDDVKDDFDDDDFQEI